MDKKERFYKIYNNLPLSLRDEIILVINVNDHKEPITWRVAKLYIDEETKLGEDILGKLERLRII